MITKLRNIGNSKGIIIPKSFWNIIGSDEVRIDIKGNELVISAAKKPRSGWDDAFKQAKAIGESDKMLIDDTIDDFKEWTWED